MDKPGLIKSQSSIHVFVLEYAVNGTMTTRCLMPSIQRSKGITFTAYTYMHANRHLAHVSGELIWWPIALSRQFHKRGQLYGYQYIKTPTHYCPRISNIVSPFSQQKLNYRLHLYSCHCDKIKPFRHDSHGRPGERNGMILFTCMCTAVTPHRNQRGTAKHAKKTMARAL